MSTRTRVVLLVENNPYPQDFRVRREAQTLTAAGCEVRVVAPRGRAQPWTERVDGVWIHRFPAPPGGRGAVSFALEFAYATFAMLVVTVWLWMRHGFDVLHMANPPDTLFAVGAAFKLVGKQVVFDQHDLAPETYLSRFAQPTEDILYRTLRLLERLSYATADLVISTNQSYRRLAIERGGRSERQVVVVRNGPPLSYVPLDPDPDIVSKAPFLIGYVGTIGPQDGVDYWLRALRELVYTQGRRDVCAVIVGDGDALPAVEALTDELELRPYVHFTGRLVDHDVRRTLSAMHVCVQPDPSSPLNDKSTMNKLMEYMALGKPTVAFDLTETRYSAGEAAILVPPNDVARFAEAVGQLLDDPGRRSRMGEVGVQRIRAGLAWEFSARALVTAYRDVLKAAVKESAA
jgi:glycosyltransferase involved in cell wall biosynthesis